MKIPPVASRLAVREYLPFGSYLLTWFLIGLSIGHADVVRLLAANAFVQAARALCTLEVVQVLARRISSPKRVWQRSLTIGVRIDLVALIASMTFLAAVALFLAARGMPKAASMVAIMIFAIPARNPGALFVARRNRANTWRVGAAFVSVAGAAAVFLLHLPWEAAAVVVALRDWGGLGSTLLFAPMRPPRAVRDEPLSFREAAVQTEASARKRLGYRLLRTLFGVLGPLGNIAARTGRAAGRLDSKIARLLPHSRPGFVLFTAGTASAAVVLLSVSTEPSSLLAAAALASIAASGGAALMWWNYRDVGAEDEDEEADD